MVERKGITASAQLQLHGQRKELYKNFLKKLTKHLQLHPGWINASLTACAVTKDLFSSDTYPLPMTRGSSNQLDSHGIAAIISSNLLLVVRERGRGGEREKVSVTGRR